MMNVGKRFLATLVSIVVLCSCMAVVSGAAYVTYNRNLNVGYGLDQGAYNMRYGVNAARAYTYVELGTSNTGKAYAALMQRNNSTGADAGFISNDSTAVKTDEYATRYMSTTITGVTTYANYVLHSGYTDGWRFDHKYQHVG